MELDLNEDFILDSDFLKNRSSRSAYSSIVYKNIPSGINYEQISNSFVVNAARHVPSFSLVR